MNTFLLLIVFFLNLSAYELQENYLFNDRIIYSNDLFPDVPKKFEILRIPDDTTHYRINAQVISKSFELYGVPVDTTKVRYVNFTQKSHIDFAPLQKQLADALRERYPTIAIEQIFISPHGYLQSLPKGVQAVYEPKFYQSSKGTFYIIDNDGTRRYLDYTVTATLNVLHTTQKVDRKESLSGLNTALKPVSFRLFKDAPLSEFSIRPYRFRASLQENTLLTERNIEPTPLVLRGQQVTVEIREGSVRIEFTATATQEGGLYDMITIQKSDGKRVKAKVIGENRVELL